MLQEEFEGTNGIIRIPKSKDKQYKKDKTTNTDLQNTPQKTEEKIYIVVKNTTLKF